ncbi:Uncharacterised protein [Klebsiella pneumoniae]|nr:Uncharacterised protein [Klebsiella pneumoniae]
MTGDNFRIVGDEKLAAHRETRVVFRFRNPGFLQQRQGCAAGTDKHVFCMDRLLLTAFQVVDADRPATVGGAFDRPHFMAGLALEALAFLQ